MNLLFGILKFIFILPFGLFTVSAVFLSFEKNKKRYRK